MSIPKPLRFAVLHRDNFTCQYCGNTSNQAPIEVDHVIPENQGGLTIPQNLITSCRNCNIGKSTTIFEKLPAHIIFQLGLPVSVNNKFTSTNQIRLMWQQMCYNKHITTSYKPTWGECSMLRKLPKDKIINLLIIAMETDTNSATYIWNLFLHMCNITFEINIKHLSPSEACNAT